MLAARRVPPAQTLLYRAHNASHTAHEQRPLIFWLPLQTVEEPQHTCAAPSLAARMPQTPVPLPSSSTRRPATSSECSASSLHGPGSCQPRVQALQSSPDIRRLFVTRSACSARSLHWPGPCRSAIMGAAKEPRNTAGLTSSRALPALHGNAP